MKTAGAVLALASCFLIAQAAGVHARDSHEPLLILTEQGNKDAEDVAFFSTVRALAAEIGVVVSTEEVSSLQAVTDTLAAKAHGQRKPLLVAWIVREGNRRRIEVYDPSGNQLRTRTLEVGTSPTANAEALALVLRAELLAHLNGPVAPPEAPLSPPAPEPPAAPPARELRWAVTAAYSPGTFLSEQGLLQGARLGIVYRWRHIGLGASYRLLASQDVGRRSQAAITIRRHPIALALGCASPEWHRLRWLAETFVIGDWVSRHTYAAQSPLVAQPDAGHFLVGVGAGGRQLFRLSRNLAVAVALGMEVPLNSLRFQIARGTSTETVTRPSPVQLSAELGVEIPLL